MAEDRDMSKQTIAFYCCPLGQRCTTWYNLLTIQVYYEMGLVFLLNYRLNHEQNDLQEVAMDIEQH